MFKFIARLIQDIYLEKSVPLSQGHLRAFDGLLSITVVILDKMITFTMPYTKPEAFLRVVKRNLRHNVNNSVDADINIHEYPYRIYHDRNFNQIVFLMDRQRNYSKDNASALLKSIYDAIPDETEIFLRGTLTRLITDLPTVPIASYNNFATIPRDMKINFYTDAGVVEQISCHFDTDTDRVHAYGMLSALVHYGDCVMQTDGAFHFEVDYKYYYWFRSYLDAYQAMWAPEYDLLPDLTKTAHQDAYGVSSRPVYLDIVACTSGEFKFIDQYRVK